MCASSKALFTDLYVFLVIANIWTFSELQNSEFEFDFLQNRYSRTHVIRTLRGPRKLFELHDFLNYRSSDYMGSTVYTEENRLILFKGI